MTSNTEVSALARSIFEATQTLSGARQTYLRTLIAEIQSDLKATPRKNAPRTAAPALEADAIAAQLEAVGRIHLRFYDLVIEAAGPFVPPGTKDRQTELHRRATFARTSASAVRSYIRAGRDITAIPAARATKASLKAPGRSDTPPRGVSRGLVERRSKTFLVSLMALADSDKAGAVDEIRLAMGQLADQLVRLGVAATKDAAQAFAEHKFLRVGKTLFMPTETQVMKGAQA